MAAPSGIVCETTATGRQQTARSTVKSGTFLRVAIGEQSLQNSTLVVASIGACGPFTVYEYFDSKIILLGNELLSNQAHMSQATDRC
jgi:hypothetical protein